MLDMAVASLAKLLLRLFFREVEVVGRERIPRGRPLLVVANAWKPSDASSSAEPRSQGLGRSRGCSLRCSSRNRLAFSA